MPPSVPLNQMQPALLDSLSTIRRKAKTLSVLFGLGVLLAATVGLILATVLFDYLLNLPAVPRLFFILFSIYGIGYTLWHWVVTPVAARLSLEDVAGRLEGAFPQFDDRLRSTVNFIGTDVPGSAAMKDRVVSEANRVAAAVKLDSALIAKPVFFSMGAGIGALILAILLGLFYSDFTRIALSRLLMVNAQQWPRRAQIDLVNALPTKVAAGQRFDLRMRLSKGDKASIRARVYYQYDDGSIQQQFMNRNDDGSYSVSLEARGTAMNIWMKADDDQTDPKKIDVVQRLAINRVDAVISPPPYAKTPPTNINLSEAPATMTYGSRVELRIGFNKPLAQDKPIALEPIKADAKLPAITWIHPTSTVAVGTFTATESMRFRVHATDTDYFDNAGLEEFDLIVKPDQMPSVIIENPRRNEDRTPVAMVNLEALAEDDFDISSMTLVVDRTGDKKHWEIPLANWFKVESGADRRRFRVKHEWELQQLPGADLKPGDVLEYYVKVTDNYNLNGAVHPAVSSGKLKINIISQEALSIQVTEALRAMAEKVKQAQNTQNRTKKETHNLKQDTEKKPQMDGGDKAALNRLNDQESTLASQTKQLAGQVADIEKRLEENRSDNQGLKDISKDVKTTLNETAENPMAEASRTLSQASDKADPKSGRNEKGQADPAKAQKAAQDRNDALEKSEAKQQEASDQLGKALEKMGNLGTFEQMLQRVRDALAQQQNLSKQLAQLGRETLGKKPEELTAEEKKKLDDLAAEQKKAGEKTDKLTQDMNKAAQQTSKSDPASSKAMEQAAQQSQQQQVASNQSQAAQQAQQNQQAQAQSKQKQAELGLQMMLDTLREAERRKLEQLAKDLAKLQDLIANLIRRQAGHNIDNLAIQGTAATLKQISDDLLAKAERLRDKMPPKPEAPALGNFQITTEKNTRDVSKTAEDLPKGGADIAATLTKAAGLMERAIISLKETKLPEAYDPSQVKALAALEDAKAKTDAALAEIQKQMEEADKESIRQAYVKIKTEQEKINLETSRIDSSPRLPDGSYKREVAVNLGKLPGQQGSLADRTQKLEEDLVALGGIVYVWANKDIVESMNEVKSDLGKPTTGVPTQSEEKRIVEQLDAMIRNLAIKPKKSDFNEPPGGGNGGGAAKPRLPSEAELRLLKELQVAVNKSTKTIDAQPKPDKAKLLGLGNRQGEMRNLLDQLMQKASQGMIKLDPEPNPKDRLPEEADSAKIENQELDEWLRGAKSSDDQLTDDVKLVGQRMARSRQRLALDADPGKTTQAIQDRILTNMDNLIQLARQQQAQASGKPGKGQQPGKKPQPNPGVKADNQGKANQSQPNNSANPANAEGRNGTDDISANSKDIREKASEWGGLTPREREAVIEGTSEHTITKYKKLTDDYYEVMGKKGTQER